MSGDNFALADLKRARNFLDATVERWGTGEADVDQILQSVHESGSQDRFESAVTFVMQMKNEHPDEFITRYHTDIVHAILKDEMSGSELARAEDLYQRGVDLHRGTDKSF